MKSILCFLFGHKLGKELFVSHIHAVYKTKSVCKRCGKIERYEKLKPPKPPLKKEG